MAERNFKNAPPSIFIRLRKEISLFILPSIVFVAFRLHYGGASFTNSDMPGYLYFSMDRPVGYPLFLGLAHVVFGSYTAAIPLQLALLCGSFGLLALAFYRHSGKLWQSLGFEALLFFNPGLLLLANQILSDGLSAVCLTLYAAALLWALTKQKPAPLNALIALTCAAILVRPVNLALVPATAVVMFFHGGDTKGARLKHLAIFAFALVVVQATTPFVHWLRNEPVATADPLARGLFQKTLFRQWPQTPETDACDGQLIAQETRDTNAYLDQTPADIRPYLLERLSGYLRFSVIIPRMIRDHHFAHLSDPDPILMCYALGRMKSDPLYFIAGVAQQFVRLLTYSTYVSYAQHDRIERYIAKNPPPLPKSVAREDAEWKFNDRAIADLHLDPNVFEGDSVIKAPHARSQILANGLRLFQIAGASIMLLGIFSLLSPKRISKAWFAIGILGIIFFGAMGITSVVEIAFPRYVYPLWPLLCAAVALCFAHFWTRLTSKPVTSKTDMLKI